MNAKEALAALTDRYYHEVMENGDTVGDYLDVIERELSHWTTTSPLDCDHSGSWHRDRFDCTWCSECGRWRDDVMRSVEHERIKTERDELRSEVMVLRPVYEMVVDEGRRFIAGRGAAR